MHASEKPIIIGAGISFNKWAYLDFDKMKIWTKKKGLEDGIEGEKAPTLIGDALLLEWNEAGSGVVYFTRSKETKWFQIGD